MNGMELAAYLPVDGSQVAAVRRHRGPRWHLPRP